jgi:hypothetical protein
MSADREEPDRWAVAAAGGEIARLANHLWLAAEREYAAAIAAAGPLCEIRVVGQPESYRVEVRFCGPASAPEP